MNSKIIFISKIAIASLILSLLVKYGGQTLPLIPNNTTALIIVLFPSVIFALFLGLRYQKLNS